jgi:hypothetical protein
MAEMTSVDNGDSNNFKGALLWEEPDSNLRKNKRYGYGFGIIVLVLYAVFVFNEILYFDPLGIILYSMVGFAGVYFIILTKSLLPKKIYENGIEIGIGLKINLSYNIMFLPWNECATYKENETSYYFADARERRRAYIIRDLPGAEEAVEKIIHKVWVTNE